jgi:hypothetical protein
VIDGAPRPTPLICGCVVGAVAPALTKTLAGDIVSLVKSLLTSATVTPPAGAADGSVTAKGIDCPKPTFSPAGSEIAVDVTTVTLALTAAIFGLLA